MLDISNLIRIEKTQPVLEWTTEPPTKEGWYWVTTKNYEISITECVYIDFPNVYSLGHTERVSAYFANTHRYWCGPITPPARPEK